MADTKAARKLERLEPLLWAVGSLLLRLPFFPLTEQDIDGANFARAVERFDLAAWAPHPPGYPVLIAAGKALSRLFFPTDAARALAAFSLLCSALLALSVFVVFRLLFCARTARLSTLLLFASPLLSLFAVRPLSDGPGTALAWACLASALSAKNEAREARADVWASLSLVCAALLPGVRLSALPFVLPAVLVAIAAARRRLVVVCLGTAVLLAWLVPFLCLVDLSLLTGRTLAHAKGHFYAYGGSALSASDPVARTIGLVRALFAHGLGGLWQDRPPTTLLSTAAIALVLLPACRAFQKARPDLRRTLLASAGLYLVWAFLGQNIVEQPRHILPLVPVMLGALASAAIEAFSRRDGLRWARGAVLGLGLLAAAFESARLSWIQARYPAPIVRLARFCEEQPDSETLVVATYRFYRWIGWRAPHVHVESVGSLEDAIAIAGKTNARVLITSEVAGAERLDPAATELRVATDPFVRFVLEDVRLLDLRRGLVHEKP